MRFLVYFAIFALVILHQDFWYWSDRTLVFGFLPIGLAYHALYSIVAGLVWALAVRFAWPPDILEVEDTLDLPEGRGGKRN